MPTPAHGATGPTRIEPTTAQAFGGVDQIDASPDWITDAFNAPTGALDGAEILYARSWSTWEDAGLLVVFRHHTTLWLAQEADSCALCRTGGYEWAPEPTTEDEALAAMLAFEAACLDAAETMEGA